MTDQSSTVTSSSPAPATLPGHLARWARDRPGAIALRHKSHGVWAAWTWRDLQAEVARVGAMLAARGFERRDVVAIAADLSPQALAVMLAAQGLGGACIWIEPEAAGQPGGEPSDGGRAAVSPLVPAARFGFAREEAMLARLHARFGSLDPWSLGLFTTEHGWAGEDAASAVRPYADVAAAQQGPRDPAPLRAGPTDAAFFFAADAPGDVGSSLSQTTSIGGARAWLAIEKVRAGGQAFAWEGPTSRGGAFFLAGWLVSGIPLSLPEDATTTDADRREVQPTIVAATRAAYGRLWQHIADNLPAPDTFLGAVVDAGLNGAAGSARGLIGEWLVRRPLREVLGFRRLDVAFVLDAAPLPAPAHEVLARLGVRLHALPVVSTAEQTAREAPASVSVPGHSTLFEPALALSSASPRELT